MIPCIVTFTFYWWHRWRHDWMWCWNLFHHSPERTEAITSFYKHPLEIERPEMRRIQHQQGRYYNNFSDFALHNMLFGFKDEQEVWGVLENDEV